MMVKLVLIGATGNLLFHKVLASDPRFEILGCVVDYNLSAECDPITFKTFLKESNIKEISFKDISNLCLDLIFVIGYSKKIDIKYFGDVLALNLHGGKLPCWRGYNANIWSVLNGNDEICYTLHKVDSALDNGDIYYIFSEKISKTEFYFEANKRLKNQTLDKIADVLFDVSIGKISPFPNDSKLAHYCTKYRTSDLVISNWQQESILFFNMYRIFVSPFGLGLFFKFKGDLYEIKQMECPLDNAPYYGIPGTIVNIQDNSLYIKTKDSYVVISQVLLNSQPVDINATFIIGNRMS